jgi:hypothetical protein
MSKNKTTLSNRHYEQIGRFVLAFLVIAMLVSCATAAGVMPALAAGGGGGSGASGVGTGALDNVMDIVVDIVSTAALYIGIVIVLWGVFQIVLAFRREDSEGISKQITTVVVGGVLVGFGAIANNLYDALTNSTP